MKFFKSYDGTREVYRIDSDSFIKPLNYLSPKHEYILRSRYVKLPHYRPEVKRLNTAEISGCEPKIANF